MHEAAVRVARHLAALTPGPGADEVVAALARQAALVAAPGLTADTPSKMLPLGFSASYWLDLRAYDPVATAAGPRCPMLILHGGRDYQVTVADDLVRRRNALAHRREVTIRIHQDANTSSSPAAATPPRPSMRGQDTPSRRWWTRSRPGWRDGSRQALWGGKNSQAIDARCGRRGYVFPGTVTQRHSPSGSAQDRQGSSRHCALDRRAGSKDARHSVSVGADRAQRRTSPD
ncbi:hypothetical protein ACFV2U_53730 [Streptomyces sp. NPDC059697]|uniref:hypothetical protein n=1 Tax=Streptomyces sp. NPDC059697 TaxID=3346912 RepID=UPI003697D3AA